MKTLAEEVVEISRELSEFFPPFWAEGASPTIYIPVFHYTCGVGTPQFSNGEKASVPSRGRASRQ